MSDMRNSTFDQEGILAPSDSACRKAPGAADACGSRGETAQEVPATDGLSAEWRAYRDALSAAARADASAPFAPGDARAAVPEPLRPGKHAVHHSYIWLGGLSAMGAIMVAVLISMVGSIPSLIEDIPAALLVPIVLGGGLIFAIVLAGIAFFVQWLSWKNLRYELGPSEFALFSGVISKKRRHVPYQRVQSVNQQAGVLQRVLGICNVKIDTAGGAANEAVTLRYVRVSDAEALRSELFRRKKILLAGGSIDEFGTAFVGGEVVPSAWIAACAGGDVRSAAFAFGADASIFDRSFDAPMSEGFAVDAAAAGGAIKVGGGNVLDGADELLGDLRGVFGGQEVATGAVSYESGLSNKELFFAGLSGAAGHFGVIIAGIVGLAGAVVQFFQSNIESWIELAFDGSAAADGADVLGGLFGSFAWQLALWAVLSVLALWAFSVIGTIVQYGGFKVRRRESRIEVEHGLLQRTFHGVDVDRVQTVIVKQSFVRRLIGYCELSVGKIDSATQDGQDKQMAARGVVIHPFVKMDRVPELVSGLLPEFADMPQETVKPAPIALRRAIVRRGIIRSTMFWVALAAIVGRMVLEAGVRAGVLSVDPGTFAILEIAFAGCIALFVIVFALNVIDAALWHRGSGLGYDDSFMSVTNDGLSRRTVVFPRKKIQYGSLVTNPFQRMAHVSIVSAVTAAGVGGTTEQLWDVSDEEAGRWLEWVRPRGNAQGETSFV
ncbi:MAG: PH domain-containing protein [Slackia sp.]|nr:PH domain-containing protein [Slackia sp.]